MALLYSAMIVSVAVNSPNNDQSDNESERELASMHSSKSPDTRNEERLTPAHNIKSEVGDHDIDIPKLPLTPGVPGLVSPGYDPRAPYSP